MTDETSLAQIQAALASLPRPACVAAEPPECDIGRDAGGDQALWVRYRLQPPDEVAQPDALVAFAQATEAALAGIGLPHVVHVRYVTPAAGAAGFLPDDLLRQARFLASAGAATEADLRRAVSAAYYALFHLLTDAGAAIFPDEPARLRHKVRRAFDHLQMKSAARRLALYHDGDAAAPFGLIAAPLEPELRVLARGFLLLQEARHDADYDHGSHFTRQDVLRLIRESELAMAAWRQVSGCPNAAALLAAMLLNAQWRA